MNTPNAHHPAEQLLIAFAEALNSANIKDIASFYSQEGVFLPDGHPNMDYDHLKNMSGAFFQRTKFTISYELNTLTVRENLAFIEATGKSIEIGKNHNKKIKSTRDFFVLRNENGDWKIFRYLFNNLPE